MEVVTFGGPRYMHHKKEETWELDPGTRYVHNSDPITGEGYEFTVPIIATKVGMTAKGQYQNIDSVRVIGGDVETCTIQLISQQICKVDSKKQNMCRKILEPVCLEKSCPLTRQTFVGSDTQPSIAKCGGLANFGHHYIQSYIDHLDLCLPLVDY